MRWIGILSLSLTARLFSLSGKGTIINDGIDYVRIAALMSEGRWTDAMAIGYHPAYPFLMSLFGLVMPFEAAGYLVSVAAAIAVIPFLWLLMRDAAGEGIAWCAVILYAVHPALVRMQSETLNISLYLFLFVLGTFFLHRCLQGRSPGYAFAFGLTLLALYATRPDAILLTGIAAVALTARFVAHVRAGEQPGARRVAIHGGILLAMILVAAAIVVPFGLIKTSARAVLTNLQTLSASRPLNTLSLLDEALSSMGPVLWMLMIPGAVLLRRTPAATFLVLSGLVYFLLMALGQALLGYAGRHYFFPATVLLLLPVAVAVVTFRQRKNRWLAHALVGLLFLGMTVIAIKPVRQNRIPYRSAGEWIHRKFGPGHIVHSMRHQPGYYARGTYRLMPDPPESILSRPGEFVVIRPEKVGLRSFEALRQRRGLEELQRFPRGVTVFRIRR